MFEGKVLELVKKYLDKYVSNLDKDVLRVGLFNGSLELTDLQLRTEALYELELPVEVKAGHVGKISVEIPSWTSLGSKPVQCTIEDVFVLVGPITDRAFDEEIEKKLEAAIKRRKLEMIEHIPNVTTDEDDISAPATSQSFLQKLLTTVINNVQVSVQRIHVRYEDSVTSGDRAMACGLMLQEILVDTTNSRWQSQYIDDVESLVHKLMRVRNVSIYWNSYLPEQSLVKTKLHSSAWKTLLQNAINTHRITDEDFEFLIRPISVDVRLTLNNDEDDQQTPVTSVNIVMDELELMVSRQQFLSLLCVRESMHVMMINERYHKYKPALSADAKMTSRMWWKYSMKAVVMEFIRPYSWNNIKQHRQNYRSYKQAYKTFLLNRDDEDLKRNVSSLEESLDVANIIMAREQAKLEFSTELPGAVTRQTSKRSWYSWLTGSSESESEDEQLIMNTMPVAAMKNLPEWFQTLQPNERETLCRGIGYKELQQSADHSSPEYVAEQLQFNLNLFSVSLVNYGKEVLKMSLTQLDVSLKNRPTVHGFRLEAKTDSFKVEGMSVEHELVQIVTSDIGVYAAPSTQRQVFSVEFEKNPVQTAADLAVRLTIQPVEIVYDERAATEIVAFFQMPNINADDVKLMAQAGLSRIARISRAGLQYAIQQHQTLSLTVNMRSPYVVIPEYGTLHRGGSVVIIDFGKLKIESDLQPKHTSLEDCTLSEIETQLYDKFLVSITDVKVLLADSGDDWHTAQTKPDSMYHIVPSVGVQISLFNTVKADYRKLPRHKMESRLSTLKVNLSDEKLRMLADICNHIPMPHSNSLMGLDDSIDGLVEPVFDLLDDRQVQLAPSIDELKHIQRAVLRNSVPRRQQSQLGQQLSNRMSTMSTGSEHYYSASDHSDDETGDWAKPVNHVTIDDQTDLNPTVLFTRLVVGGLVIEISRRDGGKFETPYVMLRLDRTCVDITVADYSISVAAQLGGIQLVDKHHVGSSGEYLEILGFNTNSDLLSFNYSKVSPLHPENLTAGRSGPTEEAIIKMSSLRVTFDREAMMALNTFLQHLLTSVQCTQLTSSMRKSVSTIVSGCNVEPYQPEVPGFIDSITSRQESVVPVETQLHVVAILDELEVKLCDNDNDFGRLVVRGLEGQLTVRQTQTTLQTRLSDLTLEDCTDNTLYSRVLSIDDDSAFDFKLVVYRQPASNVLQSVKSVGKKQNCSGKIRLRVGRLHAVFIHKFFVDLQAFIYPFIEPEMLQSYKSAAQNAVYNKIHDIHEQGTWMSLHVDIHAPVLQIPQHSESSNVISVHLGNLHIKNQLSHVDCGNGVLQNCDHVFMNLDQVQVLRGKLTMNGNVEPIHTLIEPINLSVDVKRSLLPHVTELHYDIVGKLHNITLKVTEPDLVVIFAIVSDNLLDVCCKTIATEGTVSPAINTLLTADITDAAITPIVEIEQPLLSAAEVIDKLIERTRVTFHMEGVELQLLTEREEDEPLAAGTPVTDEGEGLASLSVDDVVMSGELNNDGRVDVNVSLASLSLLDSRPHSDLAVKKLIRSSVGKSAANSVIPPMIELHYSKSRDGSKQVDVNFETIRLNVCAYYFLRLYEFLAKPFHQLLENVIDQPVADIDSRLAPSPPSANAPAGTTANATQLPMTISARLKQFEIVLFAEPTQRDSRVLVIKANASYDYFCLKNRENSEFKLKQLQVVSCIWNRATQTASMELYPCNIELKSTRESAESLLQVDVRVSDINMQISASTVHICLDIFTILRDGWFKNWNGRDCNANLSLLATSVHPTTDLWTVRNLSPEAWLNKQNGDSDLLNSPVITLPGERPIETLQFDAPKIVVVFELVHSGCYVPALSLATAVSATVNDWSKQLYVSAELQLEVNSYNKHLGVWEPLIEPVSSNGNYRPWIAAVKIVRAAAYPISCTTIDLNLEKQKEDIVDGEPVDVWLKRRRARSDVDSSETDTDSDTEMMIIKPKSVRRPGSHSSYDSVSHHSSVQGESDSEPELASTLSSNLRSVLVTDTSDEEDSTANIPFGDDEAFDSSADKPVFLTAKGPVTASVGCEDDVDGRKFEEKLSSAPCNYIVVSSSDQLLVDLTPSAIQTITDTCQSLMKPVCQQFKSGHDLPPFEIYNQLGVSVQMTLAANIQIFEDNVHNVTLESHCEKSKKLIEDELDGVTQLDGSQDEVDNLCNVSNGLSVVTSNVLSSLAVLPVYHVSEPVDKKLLEDTEALDDDLMNIKLEGFEEICGISCKRSVSRLVHLLPAKNEVDYCVVCDVSINNANKVVSLRSPLQVHNQLSVPVQLFCLNDDLHKHDVDIISTKTEEKFTPICVVEPGKVHSLPLYIAYHCQLYLAPANMLYEMTTSAIWWQEFYTGKDRHRLYSCPPHPPNSNLFYFKVKWEEDSVSVKPSCLPRLVPSYTIRLCPPVVLHNLLPYNLHYSLEGATLTQLCPGASTPLYTANLLSQPKLQLQLMNYMSCDWTGSFDLTSDLEEFKAINMEPDGAVEGLNRHLSLSIHVSQCHAMDVYVYSPYWILNKTSLPIQIRGSRSDAVYEFSDDTTEPVLFRFKKHRRKKAKLRIYKSKWTCSFCLDSVGSTGVVICNDKERCRKYQFVLHVTMSRLKLTKLVTILPQFVVMNSTTFNLRYMEDNEQADLWFDLAPQQCSAFWPATDSMKLFIKHQDSNVCSQHFPFNIAHRTVLRMDKGSALCVEVTTTDGSVVVNMLPYTVGDIPVRVDNLCEDVFLKLHQKNQSQVTLLSPNQSVLYTWDDPAAERTLMWNVYNRCKPSYPAFITTDGCGQVLLSIQTVRRSSLQSSSPRTVDKKLKNNRAETLQYESSTDDDSDVDGPTTQSRKSLLHSTRTDKVLIYWASYLDGLQRVFLLTQDERIAKTAGRAGGSEPTNFALFGSLAGAGVSLINSRSEELAFLSLSSGTTVWEVEVKNKNKNKWKVLPPELSTWLEDQWRRGIVDANLPDVLEATLDRANHKLFMSKPESGSLRRTYSPAVWLQYMTSTHYSFMNVKLHRLQIDNQLTDAYFPIVFQPSAGPAYVAKATGPKPFIELMAMRRCVPEHSINTFKYVKLLVQEFNICVDKGFALSLYDLYRSSLSSPRQQNVLLSEDLAESSRKLKDLLSIRTSGSLQRSVFEYLHLSPLKLRVSLSLDGEPHISRHVDDVVPVSNDLIDFFLNSVGAKLVDVTNVELRMALYECHGTTLSTARLLTDVVAHYRSQLLQQAYVVLFGLDVLGNPYGLVRDFTQGIEAFYEPSAGTVQQPDKFAGRLLATVQTVLGHVVGGMAGSVSSVTGSVGKCLALLSLDTDYKQSRRQLLLNRPDSLPDSLSAASHSFTMGVAVGFSGLVLNPLKGTQEKGVEGFFRGVGKGLLGLITKPTGGAFDMVSMAFDGIRRCVETGDDLILPMRLPRYIHPTLGLKPYCHYKSIGARLLRTVDRGCYTNSDIYWAHAALGPDDKADVMLITDKRVLLLEKSKGWTEWSIDFMIPLTCLLTDPVITNNTLTLRVKKDGNHGNAGSTGWLVGDTRQVECSSELVLMWLQDVISVARRMATLL